MMDHLRTSNPIPQEPTMPTGESSQEYDFLGKVNAAVSAESSDAYNRFSSKQQPHESDAQGLMVPKPTPTFENL